MILVFLVSYITFGDMIIIESKGVKKKLMPVDFIFQDDAFRRKNESCTK